MSKFWIFYFTTIFLSNNLIDIAVASQGQPGRLRRDVSDNEDSVPTRPPSYSAGSHQNQGQRSDDDPDSIDVQVLTQQIRAALRTIQNAAFDVQLKTGFDCAQYRNVFEDGATDDLRSSVSQGCPIVLAIGVTKRSEPTHTQVPTLSPCTLPRSEGPCRGFIQAWFYNVSSQLCEQFTYGGCHGNANRFEEQEDCQRRCEPTRSNVRSTVAPVSQARHYQRALPSQHYHHRPTFQMTPRSHSSHFHSVPTQQTSAPTPSMSCGGMIQLQNDTELSYTNEQPRGSESETCIWVIWAPNHQRIYFQTESVDHSTAYPNAVLSLQIQFSAEAVYTRSRILHPSSTWNYFTNNLNVMVLVFYSKPGQNFKINFWPSYVGTPVNDVRLQYIPKPIDGRTLTFSNSLSSPPVDLTTGRSQLEFFVLNPDPSKPINLSVDQVRVLGGSSYMSIYKFCKTHQRFNFISSYSARRRYVTNSRDSMGQFEVEENKGILIVLSTDVQGGDGSRNTFDISYSFGSPQVTHVGGHAEGHGHHFHRGAGGEVGHNFGRQNRRVYYYG